MAFNSSILASSNYGNNVETSMESIVSNINNESTFINILEMNDKIHDIETSSKIDYYRALHNQIAVSESGGSLVNINEGIVKTIFNKLSEILQTLINFVKDVVRKIINSVTSEKAEYKRNIKVGKNHFPKNSWYYTNEKKMIKKLYYPSANYINDINIDAVLAVYIAALTFISKGMLNKLDDAREETTFKNLAKRLAKYPLFKSYGSGINENDVKDPASFNEFLKNRLFYTELEEMTCTEWYKYYMDLDNNSNSESIYSKKATEVERYLSIAKNILKSCESTATEEHYNAAKKVVASIERVVTSFVNMINMSAKYEKTNIAYNNNIFKSHIMCKNKESIGEAGFIHGEQFDSDTLFDNEDYRDFNRTEWLDLNITTECYELKFEMVECAKRIALQEALILSDDQYNKFDRLMTMREAEEAKTKANVNGIIQSIKKWLETFIQNIKNRYSKNAKILRRNMQFVEKPITIKEIRSSGDIIAGMYRIQQRLNIIPFNYDTMNDDLKDKETFFKNKILPNLKNTSQYNKRNVKWTDGMSIADYCKAYYGASMPEDKYPKCEFSTSDVEANKNNIVRFLQTENIFSAKNDLQTLENESKKVYSNTQTNTPATSNDQKAENNTAEQKSTEKPTNESYYSELYGMWFTEAEIEMGEKPEGQQQNNSTNSEEATAFRIYMETYKDVILAKMTASEFIVSELMQIMMAHIYSHMTPEQKKTETVAQGKENPQQNNKK